MTRTSVGQRRAEQARHSRIRAATATLIGDPANAASHADRIRAVLQDEPRTVVLEAWQDERVVGLAVRAAGELGLTDDDWTGAAELQAAYSRARAGLAELVSIQVTRQLAEDGIASVVLKGSPLAERVHGDVALRDASADTDILVPTADLRRAEQLLRDRGWEPPKDAITTDGELPDLHLALHGPGPAPMIELHWRVQWYDRAQHSPWLLANATTFKRLPVADPVGLLSVLLLCWARDGFHQLRLGADVAGWWRTFGAEHGADAWTAFDASPLRRPLIIAAQSAADQFGTPAPPRPYSDRRALLARRVARADQPASSREVYSQICLVDQLVCPDGTHVDRARRYWLRDAASLRVEHPWLPAWAIPVGRVASALRTAADQPQLIARVRRAG